MKQKEENMETWEKFSSGLLTPINNLLDEKLTAIEDEYLEVKAAITKLASARKAACQPQPEEQEEVRCKHVAYPKRLNRALVKRPFQRVADRQLDEDDGGIVATTGHAKDRTDSYKTANEDEPSYRPLSTSPEKRSVVGRLPKEIRPDNRVSAKQAVQTIEKKKLSKWDCLAAGLSVSVLYKKKEHLRHTSINKKAKFFRNSPANVSHFGRTAHPFRPLPSGQSLLAHSKQKMLANKENIVKKKPHRTPPKSSMILCTKIEPKSASTTTPVKRNYIITNNELTPPRQKGQMKSETDYGIDELRSEDSTDDEECPRKQRPTWACEENLIEQVKRMRPYGDTFKVFPPVDLQEIFRGHPLPARARTSSANWHSFHRTLLEEQSMFEDGN